MNVVEFITALKVEKKGRVYLILVNSSYTWVKVEKVNIIPKEVQPSLLCWLLILSKG